MAQTVSQPAVYANGLNAELSPIFHLLALLEAHPIHHVSRIRVNVLAFADYIRSAGIKEIINLKSELCALYAIHRRT